MLHGCNRAINLTAICILGVLLYRCRQERRPVDCPNDGKWLSKHGTVYVSQRRSGIFPEENKEWKSLATTLLEARHFRTVILDCPMNTTSNYSVTELAAALASSKQTILSEKYANTGPNLWLRYFYSEENTPQINDECAQIAEVANRIHPGTVHGIVITDQALWDFAKHLFLANNTTEERVWEAMENETFVHWKRHGLMTALMISNPLLCFGIRRDFPSSLLQQFKRSFYLEYPSCLEIEDHPLPVLAESKYYQRCWISMQNMFSLELVLPMRPWQLTKIGTGASIYYLLLGIDQSSVCEHEGDLSS